jgi:hypothetical protein
MVIGISMPNVKTHIHFCIRVCHMVTELDPDMNPYLPSQDLTFVSCHCSHEVQ